MGTNTKTQKKRKVGDAVKKARQPGKPTLANGRPPATLFSTPGGALEYGNRQAGALTPQQAMRSRLGANNARARLSATSRIMGVPQSSGVPLTAREKFSRLNMAAVPGGRRPTPWQPMVGTMGLGMPAAQAPAPPPPGSTPEGYAKALAQLSSPGDTQHPSAYEWMMGEAGTRSGTISDERRGLFEDYMQRDKKTKATRAERRYANTMGISVGQMRAENDLAEGRDTPGAMALLAKRNPAAVEAMQAKEMMKWSQEDATANREAGAKRDKMNALSQALSGDLPSGTRGMLAQELLGMAGVQTGGGSLWDNPSPARDELERNILQQEMTQEEFVQRLEAERYPQVRINILGQKKYPGWKNRTGARRTMRVDQGGDDYPMSSPQPRGSELYMPTM